MKHGQWASILGETYGRITVLSLFSNINYRKRFMCQCACGNTLVVAMTHLRTGHTKSCGCINIEKPPRLSHGDAGSLLYKVYYRILGNCHNPKDGGYFKYGAKGITMCPSWKESYEVFKAWALASGYMPGLSIDRKDGRGNYTPENCRWANAVTQAVNKAPQKNNTSGVSGVTFHSGKGKWVARVNHAKQRVDLGVFVDKEDAILAKKNYIRAHGLTDYIDAEKYVDTP